jgi:uncharacterized damage-inducible protein DinB
MTSLTPDQARLILQSATLPALRNEHPITKSIIAAIPPDRAGYRPDEIVKSAIDLAWHIVGAEVRFLEAAINGAFDFTNTGRPEALRTPADINGWYEDRFAKDVDELTQLPGEQLLKIVDFRGIFRQPAFTYVQIGMNHTIHHRGQLSMYLRPMGARVPSIYGESFDARAERESREASTST